MYYFGYVASDEMYKEITHFLMGIKLASDQPMAVYLQRAMKRFIPETLDAFVKRPCQEIGLNPSTEKAIISAADLISKTSSSLTKRTLRRCTNNQLEAVTTKIERLVLSPSQSNNVKPCVAVQIDESLYCRCKNIVASIRVEEEPHQQRELVENLTELSMHLLQQALKEPLDTLPLNRIMRSFSLGATRTLESASQLIIHKAYGSLSHDQMLNIVDYFDSLLFTSDQHLPLNSIAKEFA